MQLPIRTLSKMLPALIAFASSAPAQSVDHARQLFEEAKYAEAKSVLSTLQKTDDGSAAVSYYLGRIAMIDNDGNKAVRHFERAVQLEETSALYHFWLGSAIRDVTPHVSKFRMPFNARRMKKEWERAVQLDPNQIDARYGLVQFYSMAPGVMGGSIDKARAQAAEIAKRNEMRGAIARGLIAEQQKNVAAQEAAYRQAIVAAPDSAPGYFQLGNVYAVNGKADEAFATLDQYVKRQPGDRWAMYEAGRFAGTTGEQLDRGESALKQFLAVPPVDANAVYVGGAHYWLGRIAERRGSKSAARAQYEAALKINPGSQLSRRALDALK